MNQLSFQKACFVSIGIHVLLFGSAIAVAEYARGAFSWGQGMVMVTLVGSESGSEAGISRKVKHGKADPMREVETQRESSLPLTQSGGDISSLQPREYGMKGEFDAALGRQGEQSNADSNSGNGPGLVSAEQWSIIESAIERSKNYPRMARKRGIQGIVHVRFKLNFTGNVDKVEIVKSSGYDILDTASIRTLYRAGPMPYVSGWIELPMAYVLK